jgi:hypothetical protein
VRRLTLLSLIGVALVLAWVVVGRAPDSDEPSTGRESWIHAPVGAETAAALEGRRPAPEPRGASSGTADDERVPVVQLDPAPWHLLARAEDQEKKPIPGATIAVWLSEGFRTEFLGEARTGEDGLVDFDLSALAKRTRNDLARVDLLGWAFAPGHYLRRGMPRTVGVLPRGSLEPGRWRMTFDLEKARIASGRVLDPQGAGLGSVDVTIPYAEALPKRLPPRVFTAPDGRYALPVDEPVRTCVTAQMRGFLRVDSDWFDPVGADVVVPDLRLEPMGTVPGVARFPDGSPVAGLTLAVWHSHFDAHTYVWTPRLGPIVARTDEEGRFTLALPSLDRSEAERPYKVQLGGPYDQRGIVLDSRANSHVLTFAPHRLRLQIEDELGVPLSGLGVSFEGKHGMTEAYSRGQTDGEGETSLFVSPGATGEIRFLAAGNRLFRRPLNVPAEGNESAHRIEVPDPRDLGALALRLEAPEGMPIERAELRISTADGIPLVTEAVGEGMARVPLPAGTYRGLIVARGLDWFPGSPSTVATQDIAPRFLITTGETLERTVVWTDTARLSVRARSRDGGEPVKWRTWVQGNSTKQEWLSWQRSISSPFGGELPWDETLYSSLFEPGAYVLHIEAEGHRPWQKDIRATAGRIEHIDVELERAR